MSYSNALKSAWVDVPAAMIESHGAVSAEVAQALADGIRRRTGSTLGIGITGVAGPAVARRKNLSGWCTSRWQTEKLSWNGVMNFPGDRDRVRWQATQTALDMVRRHFIYAGGKHSGI